MMRNSLKLLFRSLLCLAAFLFIASCSNEKKHVVSESKLEDVLFDYHMAEAVVQTQNLDSVTSLKFFDAVLQKHGVTKEEFDSSMVYYMRHSYRLHEIYTRLSERINNEGRLQGFDGNSLLSDASLSGDTANVWNLDRVKVFTTHEAHNILTFNFKADSTYKAGDKFILSFNTDFIYQDGSRNGYAAISMKFANDSVVTRSVSLSSTMRHTLEVDDTKRLGVKELRGFIMQRHPNASSDRNSSTLRMMVVSDIKLIKMHTEAPKDIVKADSLGVADLESAPREIPNENEKINKSLINKNEKDIPLNHAPVHGNGNKPGLH